MSILFFLIKNCTKNISEAFKDSSWKEAMQEEVLQFQIKSVWTLVDLPEGQYAISTHWLYRLKSDEHGIVIKNKVRLIEQGYTQE